VLVGDQYSSVFELMQKTISIEVAGKVQGVYYRQSTLQYATAHQLTGTVKNNPDGNVLIVATGSPEQLEALIDWCKKGPLRAVVTNVLVQEQSFQIFTNFSIIR
jgi:acylphosphatase